MHSYISCVTILQSLIKIGQAFLEELRSQSYSDGRTDRRTQTITMSLRRGRGQKGYTGWIYTFIQTRNNRVQTHGWPTL